MTCVFLQLDSDGASTGDAMSWNISVIFLLPVIFPAPATFSKELSAVAASSSSLLITLQTL